MAFTRYPDGWLAGCRGDLESDQGAGDTRACPLRFAWGRLWLRRARGPYGDGLRAGGRVHGGWRAVGSRAPSGGRVAGGGAVCVCHW